MEKITLLEIRNKLLELTNNAEVAEIAELSRYFTEVPPEGLFPTSYHTLSYAGDLKLHNRLKELLRK